MGRSLALFGGWVLAWNAPVPIRLVTLLGASPGPDVVVAKCPREGCSYLIGLAL